MSKYSRLRVGYVAGTAAIIAFCCGAVAAQADLQREKPYPESGGADSRTGLALFFTPSANPQVAPGSMTRHEPSMTFAWQFGSADTATSDDGPLRKSARSYDNTISVPEPGALLTAAVALSATGVGMAVGRRRRRTTEDTEEWDGSDDSVLAS